MSETLKKSMKMSICLKRKSSDPVKEEGKKKEDPNGTVGGGGLGPIKLKKKEEKDSLPPAASVFASSSSDEEEMPAEARMRMRNVGRETVTSSGPNSFGKTKQGFIDFKKLFEKQLQEDMDKVAGE
ncbi:unnamed protein product [Lepeophtheirus salmonis]|uniref:PEST proteolytic signal-containing nuclear protein n=1 Tax=Lepeophtheirus salmonis TaxID=72036 RepID=A0A7R8H5V8_LEPSM|nr:PEST proteolytic signal-containing nuclear protein-like [Lepeophtheirus salmonis]CAB4061476.1 unnamed protein product [Lepeophtheirus salmonis]CAF2885346.1 unnamed protein product [Lepeophtheirus salmonis]